MEYSLESNERTLVMFDSVCSGLTSCLALVHADIRHMTDHRNRLALIEQEQIRAKCRSAQDLFDMSSKEKLSNCELSTYDNNPTTNSKTNKTKDNKQSKSHNNKSSSRYSSVLNTSNKTDDSGLHDTSLDLFDSDNQQQQQQHHQYLAGAKFLDKRLAESFTQAFNLNEQQKSSIAAKEQAYQARPSIFQVLLGKTLSRKSSTSSSSTFNTSHHRNHNHQNKSKTIKQQEYDEQNYTNSRKSCPDNKLIIDDINRQIRLAMQYIKQLESHLFKLDELRPKYEMHLKMGLVVNKNNISHHNSTLSLKSSSKNKIVSEKPITNLNSTNTTSYTNLNNNTNNYNRNTIKEFIDNITKIEQEFESYMGSFLVAIEDIQGFARVCQGDVFEIAIKYGEMQKFKTRISVLKDNKQKCDNRQYVFKAKIADILAIKAYECKGLGKRVLLGHKLCETRDLFTAQSQLMTISLNQTGSIKLNMVVTWNPLHMAPATTLSATGLDISHISLPPTPISSSTLSSLSSTSNHGGTTTINIKSQNRVRSNDSFNSGDNNSCGYNYHNPQHQNISPTKVQTNTRHSHNRAHHLKQQALYQTIDPTYGYYIPAPDYLPNNAKYIEN